MRNFVLLALLALTACDTIDSVLHSPQNAVYSAASALSAADTAALAYVRLPICGETLRSGMCSDLNIILKIEKARKVAYTAVKAAEKTGAQSDIDAARSAVSALQTIVSTVSGS